ncbi:replication protein [Staphylococcus saprophyticus]|nr:replication protein [Staphylococcus saprophyticus]
MSEKRDTRTRNWTFFVYPESAPENCRDVLN